MKSIKQRIHRLFGISIAVLSVVMILGNIFITNSYSKRNAERLLGEACRAQSQKINGQLSLIELAVQNMYVLAEKMRPSYEELVDSEKCDAFISEYKRLAAEIADKTAGSMTVYYRLNPELTGNGVTGFFNVRAGHGKMEEHEITDLYDFDPSEAEYVGWYYIPVEAGEPMWMDTYYNGNLEANMISYVLPMYDNGRLLGVVGMDVDFERLIELVEEVDLYEDDGACLYSTGVDALYYKECDALRDSITDDFREKLVAEETSQELISCKAGGHDLRLTYATLQNGMKLIVYADSREIYKQRNLIIILGVIIIAVALVLTYMVVARISNRITNPIADLTAVTRRYADGDWDASATCDSQDELQVLTENVSLMAENTRKYLSYINNMAQKDGLTGFYNKAFYLQYVEQLQEEYKKTQTPYAVVVLDVNNLKYINDKYGHEKGDELLLAAADLIWKEFPNNSYFRIGGDEFAIIIEGASYAKRTKYLEDFQSHMRQPLDKDDVSQVCVASGFADCPEDGEDYDALFKLADERMYENKRELKGGELPR